MERWSNGAIHILDFGFWILDLTTDKTAEHQLSVISIQNLNSKIQNQDRSKDLLNINLIADILILV